MLAGLQNVNDLYIGVIVTLRFDQLLEVLRYVGDPRLYTDPKLIRMHAMPKGATSQIASGAVSMSMYFLHFVSYVSRL